MERRKFTREFKLEAVRLIKDRGVFDHIERFYNPKRRHSTIGYLSPMEFERKAGLAKVRVNETGCRP